MTVASRPALGRLGRASAWPGRAASWLILLIVVAVLTAIIASVLRVGEFVRWDADLPLLGRHLSLTGIVELQWHLFAIMVMLGGAYALREDRHVRVDFIYARLSRRAQRVVDLVGDLVLLLPFCALVAWLSVDFVELAYRSGEQSDYGGLTDRWLIKLIMPIGLVVLFLAGLIRVLETLLDLLRPHTDERDEQAAAPDG